MRKLLLFFLTCSSLQTQTITWTKQTGTSAPNPPYFIQWEKLTQNPYNHTTLLWGNDGTGGLFGNSLWNFTITDPSSVTGVTTQKLGTTGTHAQDCSFSREDFPGDRQFNGGFWYDSNRNAFIEFEGVCNLGHPDGSDRMDMWKYAPHYPLNTLGEHWQRMNPSSYPATQQIWGSGVHDPRDDFYFFSGWGTSSEAPKLYCPTDLNPTPGTLTAAQTTLGCTLADTWQQPDISSYKCKASPGDNPTTCNNTPGDVHQIPQAQALEYLAWDSATNKILIVGESSAIVMFASVRSWTFDPPTKTFTEVTSLSTPPPLYLHLGDAIPLISFNSSDGLYYYHQKEGYSLAIANAGSGYTPGTYPVTWTGSCTNKPSATYTVDGTHTIVSTTISYSNMPSVDCINVAMPTVAAGGGTNAALSIAWIPPHLWTLTPSTWVWVDAGAQGGPAMAQSMAVVPEWNSLVAFEYNSAGAANLWVGKLSAAVAPTITALSIPLATNGAAYSQQLTAAGSGAFTWTCCAVGSLPTWATLDSTGLLHGTPNAAGATTFTATVANGTAPNATQQYTLVVAPATLSIPITLQEALYPGDSTGHTSAPGTGGIARTNEPFCMGVPIPDSAQIDGRRPNTLGLSGSDTGLATLGLTGTTAGQFRVLATWPDGRAKWVEACGIVASVGAGATTSVTLTNTGSGNFGGSNMATEASSTNTIVVNTGSGSCGSSTANCFTFKKTGHNGIDKVQIGTSTVINTGSGQAGFALTGPDATQAYPANVTCGTGPGQSPCTQLYSSSSDNYSYCMVEKNGPVQAVIVCFSSHVKAGTNNAYMRTKVRYYLTQGKSSVKATVSLMNSDVVESSTNGSINDTAAYGTAPRFGTAFKGHQAYELRIVPNLTGTLTYTFSNHTGTPTAGTMSATDAVYLYQARSKSMNDDAANPIPVPYTTDTGYSIVRNGSTVSSGTNLQYPQGWADISDSTGKGVEIGIYQMAAYWPKSLEFNGGGTDVRIGIWPSENSQPYYQAWPQQSTHEIYLIFHAAAPSSLSNEFLKLQHPLIGRAAYASYNAAAVFPYPLISSVTEDNFYQTTQATSLSPLPVGGSSVITAVTATNPAVLTVTSGFASSLVANKDLVINGGNCTGIRSAVPKVLNVSGTSVTITADATACSSYNGLATVTPRSPISAGAACCISDYGVTDGSLVADRYYAWSATGGNNQGEFRFSDLMNFITRGYAGRYIYASHFYRYQGDTIWPRSLGFTWNGRPHNGTSGAEVDNYNGPSAGTDNSSLSFRNWVLNSSAQEHQHWYGMTDYYMMSGDESIRDALVDGPKDYFMNLDTYQAGANGGVWNSRAVGANLAGAARLYNTLSSISDADASTVLATGKSDYVAQVKADLCLSGYPAGCNNGPIDGGAWLTQGTSKTRGVMATANSSTGSSWCGAPHSLRQAKSFMLGILNMGLTEFRNAAGPSWSEYWNALDYAYGIARFSLTEMYADNGTNYWDMNGFRYQQAIDWANNCTAAGESPQLDFYPQENQDVSPHFLVKTYVDGGTSDWVQKFRVYLLKNMAAIGLATSDFGSIWPQAVIGTITNPGSTTLNNLTITNLVDNGGGSYTISWTVPSGAQFYRVKWAPHTIVDWIGYDPGTGSFMGSPATTSAWFAAANAPNIPSPGTAGTTQSMTIATGTAGLALANFSVKAMAPSSPSITTTSPLTGATNGVTYTQTFSATGGTLPLAWTKSSGILPPGLTLSSAGVLSGNPTQTGRHYTFTIQATDALGVAATKTFDMHVYAKFTYGNPYATPAGCTHTNSIYAPLDLNTCQTTGEIPFGTFSIPAVGQSYTDTNFGTEVTVLSQSPSTTTYYDPSALSATGKYAAIAVNGVTTIINPVNGAVVRANAPGFLSSQTLEWDKNDDDKYYWPTNTLLKMGKVSDGSSTTLIDFSTAINPATGLAFGLTGVDNGGTGDISSDNWMALYSDTAHHLALLINLNNLHIYSADYKITRNGVTPGDVQGTANGFVTVSRGIDSVSGKRYVMVVTAPMVIYSLMGDPNNGLLTYERLGPEMPVNSFDVNPGGNDNNICEPGESCWFEGHGTMFQDADGQQYYVWIDAQGLNFKAGNDGESRGIEYARLNAGDLMLRSAAYEAGGGRTDAWLEYSLVQAGDPYKDNHPGCAAKAPYCVISQDPGFRASGDMTSPYPHAAHDGNIAVISGVGQEIRTLAYARTVIWGSTIASITNVSNATPIVITTNVPNPVLEGMPVCVYNTGLAAVDVRTSGLCRTAHVLTGTTFSLNGSTASGTPASYTAICDNSPCGAHMGLNNQYWPHAFASLSPDGSRAIWNSNFGYYTPDGSENVVTALTGVNPAPSITSSTPLPGATVGSSYGTQLTATGGTVPLIWDMPAGSLPAGLSLSPAGTFSGTPSQRGTSSFTVRVRDASSSTDSKPFQLTVAAPALRVSGAAVSVSGTTIVK